MNHSSAYLLHPLRQLQADCRVAVDRIRRCTRIELLPSLVRVPCSALVRPLARRDLAQVEQAGEERALALVAQQLQALDSLVDPQARQQAIAQLRQVQRQSLQGNFPRAFQALDRALAAPRSSHA